MSLRERYPVGPRVVDYRDGIPVEVDPHGIPQHAPGAKLDSGKVRADQLLRGFARALQAVAEVGEHGAHKYTLGGWEQVPGGEERYADARMRHWLARQADQRVDRDARDPHSALLHLAHEAWNVLAELELALRRLDSVS